MKQDVFAHGPGRSNRVRAHPEGNEDCFMRLEIVDSGPGISTVRTVRYPKCLLYFFILHCTSYIYLLCIYIPTV